MVLNITQDIRMRWRRMVPALALALLLLGTNGAGATSAEWNGSAGTSYNNTANWNGPPGTVPGDGGGGETASFKDTGAGAVNIGTATANGVGFSFSNSAGHDYTITVADGVTQALTGLTTIGSGNVTLAANGSGTYTLSANPTTFDLADGQTTTVSGVITGANGLKKDGNGTLTLSGNNTYAGDTGLNGGTLLAGNNSALGTGTLRILHNGVTIGASTAGIQLTNAIGYTCSTFNIGGAAGTSLTLTGNISPLLIGASINHTGASSDTLAGVISGSCNVTVDSGTLILSGANTYSAGTTLNGGILLAGNDKGFGNSSLSIHGGTIGASTAGIVVDNFVNVSGSFNLGGDAGTSLTLTQNLNMGSRTLTHNGASTDSLTGAVSGTGGKIVVTDGTLTLSGANTYSGGTTITAGTLTASNNAAVGTGLLTVNGGTLDVTAAGLTVSALAGTGGTVDLGGRTLALGNDAGVRVYSGLITGTAASGITYNNTTGGSSLTLSGANVGYAGTTTLTAGTLAAGDNSAFGSGGLTINGGTLAAGATGISVGNAVTVGGSFNLGTGAGNDLTLTSNLALGGNTITQTGAGRDTLSGIISSTTGGNGIVVTAGTLTLSGANTYNGGTTLNGGTLAAGDNSAFGTGGLILNGGTLQAATGTTVTVGNAITMGGAFVLGGASGDNLTLTSDIANGGALLTVSSLGNTTLAGVLSGAGGITQAGGATGVLTLSGPNTYTGPTTFTSGTIVAGNQAFGTGAGAIVTVDTGTLQAAYGGAALANAIVNNTSLTVGGANNLTLSGGISGAGALNVNTTGTLTLSGSNTYLGNTTLTAGTLLAASNNAFGAGNLIINGGTLGGGAANVTVANTLGAVGGDFNLGGASGTSLTLTQNLDLGGHTLTHNGTGSDTLSGAVANGALTVTAGTLNLTNNNTYNGTTTVSGGTLNISGDNASSLTQSGGTVNLNGAGANYTGATTTLTGGSLNQSAGTLTTNLSITGATFNLSGGTLDTSTGFTLGVGGTFNFTGGSFITGAYNNPAGTTFNLASGMNMTVGGGGLTNNGTIFVNGTLTGNLTNNPGGLVKGSGILTGTLTNNGTVNPGNSPGTLRVGSYTANAGSNTVIEIASGGNYDRIIATDGTVGSITLNSGSTLSPTLSGGFIPNLNQVFTNVLTATNGGKLTGTFATVNNQRISRTLYWQPIYGPTALSLQAVGCYNAADLNLNANQMSVANVLQGLSTGLTNGDLWTVINAINQFQSNEQVQGAYNEISPMKHAGLPVLTWGLTRMQNEQLQNRLARLRWESELASGGVLAAGGGLYSGLNFNYENKMLMASTNLTASDAGAPAVRQSPRERRWGLYVEPLVNWGNIDGNFNNAGYRSVSAGFSAGVDFWVKENFLLGLNTGYYHTDANLSGTGGNVNVNTIPVNAYASFFTHGFYANGLIGYTHNGYDNARNIGFGTINRVAKSGTDGNQFQLAAAAGYDLKSGHAVFGPTLSLQYAATSVAGFTETGAGSLNQAVGNQSAASVQTGLGARAFYRVRLGNVVVKPQLAVVWQHEYADRNRGLNARLATVGGGAMTFRTTRTPGKDFAVVNAEVSARFTPRLVGNVGYTGELGRSNAANHALMAGLRLEF